MQWCIRTRVLVPLTNLKDNEEIVMTEKLVNVRAYHRYRLGQWEHVCKHKRSYPKRYVDDGEKTYLFFKYQKQYYNFPFYLSCKHLIYNVHKTDLM